MTSGTNRPLRVLILTYIYTDWDPRYGGEGRVVWETTQALARAGVKVFVVTSMKDLRSTPHPNITLYKIPFAKKKFLNFDAGELLKMFFFCIPLIYLKNIDVIHHLPTGGPDPFARFKFGRIFAESADPPQDYENPKFGEQLMMDRRNKLKEAGIKKSRWSLNLAYRLGLRFFKLIGADDRYPKGTDIFFYRARSFANTLQALRPESTLFFTPNGVDPQVFSPHTPALFPRTRSGIRFIHVGSINRRKGSWYLVQAFIAVLQKYPESELFLVGRGEADFLAELKQLAAPYPQIQFHHDVSHEDLPGAYASGDVFCLVPLSGSTPTVLGEGLATGLPIIATTESGSGEEVERYNAGLLVEPTNVESLAEAMITCIEKPELVKQKAANALAASKFFTWDYIAQTLIEGYSTVLAQRGTLR